MGGTGCKGYSMSGCISEANCNKVVLSTSYCIVEEVMQAHACNIYMYIYTLKKPSVKPVVNPWHMRKKYGSRSVCVSLSVAAPQATSLVRKSRVRCCKIPYGVSIACIVWINLKTLCSPVFVSFA
jgi:hypothetical protein